MDVCRRGLRVLLLVFFFNDTATTEIYTLSLHDALPISDDRHRHSAGRGDEQGLVLAGDLRVGVGAARHPHRARRSEEHTSELQSRQYLVCRLLLEKKSAASTPRPLNIRKPLLMSHPLDV